jgi:two-component system NtrC family sensor kinase
MTYFKRGDEDGRFFGRGDGPAWPVIRELVFRGQGPKAAPFFTANGSFWTRDAAAPVSLGGAAGEPFGVPGGEFRSVAVIRFEIDAHNAGLLELASRRYGRFTKGDVEFYEDVAQAIGIAIADRRAQRALRERVKELTCLYGIAQAAQRPRATLDDILRDIARLTPAGFQFADVARARITLDGEVYASKDFDAAVEKLSAEISVEGDSRGLVEVGYVETMREVEGAAFLPEERELLEAVARQISLIVERRESAEERRKLEEQLWHADRLATIGQLAAGVAHELNEPLANVLGFAELAAKGPGLPPAVARDLEKIMSAALHGREIVKKLLIFGRQMPARKTRLDLNDVVEEGLYFLEARCAKEGAEIVRSLAAGLPPLDADASQLQQVLVNLVVNAVQAMPAGGVVTISTARRGDNVLLAVEDTGVGMSEEVKRRIFIPFFTTKDVGRGTGLGLPVVHGIVTAHGGAIDVETREGAGSRFVISLPAAGIEGAAD